MPFKVFEQLVKHPLTDSGLEKFLGDWARAAPYLGELPASYQSNKA
jgi:hypothetical protein